jgi:transposase
MRYVYILQSISRPDQLYTGLCKGVAARLTAHQRRAVAAHGEIQAVEAALQPLVRKGRDGRGFRALPQERVGTSICREAPALA